MRDLLYGGRLIALLGQNSIARGDESLTVVRPMGPGFRVVRFNLFGHTDRITSLLYLVKRRSHERAQSGVFARSG